MKLNQRLQFNQRSDTYLKQKAYVVLRKLFALEVMKPMFYI